MSEAPDTQVPDQVPERPTSRSHVNRDKKVDRKLDAKFFKGEKVRVKDSSGTVTGMWKISSLSYSDSLKDWEYEIEDLSGIKHSSLFAEAKLKTAK